MRRVLILVLSLSAAAPATADSSDIAATPLTAASGVVAAPVVGRLDYLAGFELTSADGDWGGISGASITPDGGTLTAVADTGMWHRLSLRHDADGRLTAIEGSESGRLKGEDGSPLADKGVGDAESVARGADGSYYVTFEGWHRLWRYRPASDPLQATAGYVRPPKGMTSLPMNEGVEAVAVLPDGRFLLLSEGGRTKAGDLLGWVGSSKRWSEVGLVPTDAFRPTDLTVLPTGDLLLLERRVSLFGGFAARLSVIPASDIEPGARLVGRELGIIAKPLPVDNFEAVAAHAGPDGAVLIYLLSDNNFSAIQRTLLLQFRWRP
ncbi:MAG: esterase-like activity of phytase family protein [Dongiaceae bacterium]